MKRCQTQIIYDCYYLFILVAVLMLTLIMKTISKQDKV